MLVLAIETSTSQATVTLGSDHGVHAGALVSSSGAQGEIVASAVEQLLEWSGNRLSQLAGVAVGLGPGLFTGLRIGVATARTLAQVLRIPIVGIGSLDVLAFSVRYSRRRIGAVIDAKRGEVFYAFYRPVPGGVARETDYGVGPPSRLVADLEASREDTLLVGGGALRYRDELDDVGAGVEFGSGSTAFPVAESLLELALPRFYREESSRVEDIVPIYLRKSDAEIDWSRRAGIA